MCIRDRQQSVRKAPFFAENIQSVLPRVARRQNYGKTELSRQTELAGKDLLLNVSFGQVVMIVKTYFPHRHSLGIFRKDVYKRQGLGLPEQSRRRN